MKWSRVPDGSSKVRPAWSAIVGAPRCGTTSLARYLADHPQICLSNVKEPHFFSRRDMRSWPADDVRRFVHADYVDHFFPHRSSGDLLLDGSVSYLYAPERLEPALKIWPDARFVIAVRNPLDMLPSLHRRMVWNGDEDVQDFERAWSLIGERRSGKHIPRTCIDPRLLDYEEIGRLAKYLQRFFEVVGRGKYVGQFLRMIGRERCFVSVFDDLAADPASQYSSVVEFLGLRPDPRAFFPAFRATSGVRSAALQRLLKRPPKAARSLLASAADLHREGRQARSRPSFVMRARKRLLSWNRTAARPVILSPELRKQMCAAFSGDVETLSNLLDRDFSHWLNGSARRAPQACSRHADLSGSLAPATLG